VDARGHGRPTAGRVRAGRYIEAADAFLAALEALRATRFSCFFATAALAEASPAGDTDWPADAGAPLPWADATDAAATSIKETRTDFIMSNLFERWGDRRPF
jgi:hypothetical protein